MASFAVGLTTVYERRFTLLPKTLESLTNAGFNRPHLFIDGAKDISDYALDLELTCRSTPARAFGNWWLGLVELFVRNSSASHFAMFQDDMIASQNLREYLEQTCVGESRYWNLYTFPQNYTLRPSPNYEGWYESNQYGRGAVGLVFTRKGVIDLLTQRKFVEKPLSAIARHRVSSIDGIVSTCLKEVGCKELVHSPSLLQHQGELSTIDARHNNQPQADSFRGETFDCLSLLGAMNDSELLNTSDVQNL